MCVTSPVTSTNRSLRIHDDMQQLDNTGRDKLLGYTPERPNVKNANDDIYLLAINLGVGHTNPATPKAAILDWNARVMHVSCFIHTFQQNPATNPAAAAETSAHSGVWQKEATANYPITGRCTLTATDRVKPLLQDAAE